MIKISPDSGVVQTSSYPIGTFDLVAIHYLEAVGTQTSQRNSWVIPYEIPVYKNLTVQNVSFNATSDPNFNVQFGYDSTGTLCFILFRLTTSLMASWGSSSNAVKVMEVLSSKVPYGTQNEFCVPVFVDSEGYACIYYDRNARRFGLKHIAIGSIETFHAYDTDFNYDETVRSLPYIKLSEFVSAISVNTVTSEEETKMANYVAR